MRCCQQDELYAAERRVTHSGISFHSVEEVQLYVDIMRDNPWWERNFPDVAYIEVQPWREGKSDAGGYQGNGVGVIPWHPAWGELLVVHEVCHVLASARYGQNGHGPWFARTYLEAVYAYLGPQSYAELADQFAHRHVDADTDNSNPAGIQL